MSGRAIVTYLLPLAGSRAHVTTRDVGRALDCGTFFLLGRFLLLLVPRHTQKESEAAYLHMAMLPGPGSRLVLAWSAGNARSALYDVDTTKSRQRAADRASGVAG
jgi:hypothetical protein